MTGLIIWKKHDAGRVEEAQKLKGLMDSANKENEKHNGFPLALEPVAETKTRLMVRQHTLDFKKQELKSNHDFENRNEPEQNTEKVSQLVQEASRIADETISREFSAGAIITSSTVDFGSESPLIQKIDQILELVPDDPDFLFAKSEAYYAHLDGETGQKYIQRVLAISPDYFDAVMREKHFQQWDHLFCYPGWYESMQKVPPMMLDIQSAGHPVQIVRDGLKLTLTILMPAERDQLFSEIVESRWKPIWVDTPYGPVFEHYVLLKLTNGDIRRQEMTISPYPVEPVNQCHGNWLIRRFCEVNSIFLAFNDDDEILYNQRLVYPESLRSTLATVKKRLDELTLPEDHNQKFMLAAQWYMQNSNLEDVAF